MNEYKERASIKKENEVINSQKMENNNNNIESEEIKEKNSINNSLKKEDDKKEDKEKKSDVEDKGTLFGKNELEKNQQNNDNNFSYQNDEDSNKGLFQSINSENIMDKLNGNKNKSTKKKVNNLDGNDNNYSKPVYKNTVRIWNKEDFEDNSNNDNSDEDDDLK